MAIHKRIKELQAKVDQLKAEPGINWLGKWAKSIQVHNLEKRIASLRKELKPNHHPKKDTFDPNIQ